MLRVKQPEIEPFSHLGLVDIGIDYKQLRRIGLRTESALVVIPVTAMELEESTNPEEQQRCPAGEGTP